MKVTIIGGGIIGLSCAYALIQQDIEVLLIDAHDDVGLETSYANGGQLSYRYVSPLADAGVIKSSLAWLGRPTAPLNMRIRLSPEQVKWQWQWLLDFIRACNKKTNVTNGVHILRLSLLSQQILHKWIANGLDNFAWQKNGKIILYKNDYDLQKAASKIDPEFQKLLNADETIQTEPALAHIHSELKGAIFTPHDETADCHKLCVSVLKELKRSKLFTFMPKTKIKNIICDGTTIKALEANQQNIEVDNLVMAAGNGARDLLASLGISVPIYPLKGYSLTVPFPNTQGAAPLISVTDYSQKIVYAKLDNVLRIAAMVDIGYENVGLRKSRINALKEIVRSTLPRLENLDEAQLWTGLRPATPKGPPILGKTRYKNLFLNIGHGSLGFTLAAGSAEIIKSLLLNQPPQIDLQGLSLADV